MQKLYTLLAGMLLFSATAFSQMHVALVGGPHWASVNETNSLSGWDTIKPFYSNRSAFNVGLQGEIPLGPSKRWFFQPGIFYMGKGRKFAQTYDTLQAAISDTLIYKQNFYTNYIDLPLNLAYKLPLGKKTSFILSAGPYIGFFLSGKITNETRAYSNNKFDKEELSVEVGKAENKVKTFDFGVNARAGFDFGKVLLTGFISQGLTSFYTASYDGTFKHQVIGASVGFWLNSAEKPAPRDKDKDGIVDAEDACPTIPGTAATHGCPDKDGDGIADATDKCPDVPGLARFNGCPIPDTDKDGVNDEEDKCPTTPGLKKYLGCPIPDTDKDGINDEEDACPQIAGLAEYKGCPAPDNDNDGVLDKDDKCPDVPGLKDNNGCPEIKKEIVEKVNFAARNIFFDMNSDKIQAKSFPSLNEVADLLKQHQELKMDINGYTDNIGAPAYNKVLSQKRAEAVRNYLISKGVSAESLHATGFGQESPIAPNTTPAGKAKNRRVELILEQQ